MNLPRGRVWVRKASKVVKGLVGLQKGIECKILLKLCFLFLFLFFFNNNEWQSQVVCDPLYLRLGGGGVGRDSYITAHLCLKQFTVEC